MAPVSVPIAHEGDLVIARARGRDVASSLGFRKFDQTLICTAASELARNILSYSGIGAVEISRVLDGSRRGICVRAIDDGPGISDVVEAQREGFSTGGGLGLGLSGVQRLMDEFSIETNPGQGTRVEVRKWL